MKCLTRIDAVWWSFAHVSTGGWIWQRHQRPQKKAKKSSKKQAAPAPKKAATVSRGSSARAAELKKTLAACTIKCVGCSHQRARRPCRAPGVYDGSVQRGD